MTVVTQLFMPENKLYKKLRQPFDLRFISWKINNYNHDKTKALIIFYLDARAVQHRLNEVLGVQGWSFSFSELDKDEGVHGKLTVNFLSPDAEKATSRDDCVIQEVTREDVGYAATTEKTDWYKDAVSDALKRCAVHFGVGHFLYALPHLWVELNQPGQKYLTSEQDTEIRSWLAEQLERLNKQAAKT